MACLGRRDTGVTPGDCPVDPNGVMAVLSNAKSRELDVRIMRPPRGWSSLESDRFSPQSMGPSVPLALLQADV